ncbi:MAG: hypothetical protein U5R31_16910 [Acidimicrobiia bacterium]|nr:hypothetical protein [Acidimicrobiia bacterium]
MEAEPERIPTGDLYLLLNVAGYLGNPTALLEQLYDRRKPRGQVAIRQYDGDLLRVGPMPGRDREAIDSSLKAAVGCSDEFHHYDLDRVVSIADASPFDEVRTSFEIFQRFAPFDGAFERYLAGHLDWVESQLSDRAAALLRAWRESLSRDPAFPGYFVEVDVVVSLS